MFSLEKYKNLVVYQVTKLDTDQKMKNLPNCYKFCGML